MIGTEYNTTTRSMPNNIIIDDCIIEKGSLWEHTSGAQYQVICFTNIENTREKYPLTIIYQHRKNKNIYSRRADDWLRSMKMIDIAD